MNFQFAIYRASYDESVFPMDLPIGPCQDAPYTARGLHQQPHRHDLTPDELTDETTQLGCVVPGSLRPASQAANWSGVRTPSSMTAV
jgi:hypothetical protein